MNSLWLHNLPRAPVLPGKGWEDLAYSWGFLFCANSCDELVTTENPRWGVAELISYQGAAGIVGELWEDY